MTAPPPPPSAPPAVPAEDPPEPAPDAPDVVEPAPPRPRLAPPRRPARFLLLGGAVLAASQLLPQLPRERHLALRLDDPTTVTSVEVTWAREGRDEPLAGASFRFDAGRAPRRLESTVRLPDGAYDVDVVVVRVEGGSSLRRRVTLEGGDDITLSLTR